MRTRLLGTLASCTVLLTACGGPSSPPSKAAQATTPADFALVAYQGAAVFGGKQSHFARVFDQGEPVVLNFWAGLCPPCRAEMPGFQKVSTELSGKVLFVGIDIGQFVDLGKKPGIGRRAARAITVSLTMTAAFMLIFASVGIALSRGLHAVIAAFPAIGLAVGILMVLIGGWMAAGGTLYIDLGERAADRLGGIVRGPGIRAYFAYGLAYALVSLSCTCRSSWSSSVVQPPRRDLVPSCSSSPYTPQEWAW